MRIPPTDLKHQVSPVSLEELRALGVPEDLIEAVMALSPAAVWWEDETFLDNEQEEDQ